MRTESKLKAEVEVRDLDPMDVVYLRHIGPYAGDGALFGRLFTRLLTWAGPRGLMGPSTKMLAVYHDNPSVTEESRLRTDVCLTATADTSVDGEIGKSRIPGGRYAVAHFEIGTEDFGPAWQAVMGGWLPESGYQPTEGPCFELYRNDPGQHPEGKCVVDICVPVKPL